MGLLSGLGRSADPPSPERLRTPVHAAGAVLWRPAERSGRAGAGADIEVALVHRPKYDDWSLPKGKVESGEHGAAAAVREVGEETGFACALGRELGVQSYAVGERLKLVRYWAAEARGGRFTANREVDRIAWLSPDDAGTLMSYGRDVQLLVSLTSRPHATAPVIVLRHCGAVARTSHRDGDADRPLTAAGRLQAAALGDILAAYGPAAVLSSPSLRCLESVDPYCRRAGVAVEVVPALSEEGHADRPDAAGELLKVLVAQSAPVIICTHRPVLPSLLRSVGRAGQPGRDPNELLLPGEFLALHTAAGVVVAADRHAPYPTER
ncbi:NUDIX hydrolase [Streptodolium elevatio]